MDIKKFKELSDEVPKGHLPLMGLINEKIDNDMEKVLNKINTMERLLWGLIIVLVGLVITLIVKG